MTGQRSDAAGPAPSALPSALAAVTSLARRLQGTRPVLFLDYDGTLTPIVARPHLAVLSESVRGTLSELADRWPVAIVSGRDRADVQRLVGIDRLIYAGSHGFDIRGPELSSERGAAFLADLDSVEQTLRQALASIDGALLERKRYSLAVHVRGLAAHVADAVESGVDAALSRRTRLRKGTGKMVFELLPRVDWNKGKAVLHILETLRTAGTGGLPIYVGDDRTDEDAFMALAGRGVGILVAETPRETAAYYTLRDPDEVHRFLRRLLDAVAPAPHPL
ncbi:MAG: trehalose-phosphatase [Candidatus Tectomicrobia bacterium]|nr:trehalose-phosphatase [Candidatus Tectomicrobia bacterium]